LLCKIAQNAEYCNGYCCNSHCCNGYCRNGYYLNRRIRERDQWLKMRSSKL
jgi:hypothetical protein